MGTDIHLYVEKLVDNKWQVCIPPKKPPEHKDPWWECFHDSTCHGYYDRGSGEEIACPRDLNPNSALHCDRCQDTGRNLRWYCNRNYCVFAILADVRNYDSIKYIAKPRGCPDDASDSVMTGNLWDHTPSWFLVSELLAYPWGTTTRQEGVIEWKLFKKWRKITPRVCPDEYRRSCSGTVLTEAAALEAIASNTKIDRDAWVKVSWEETTENRCSDFVEFVNKWLVPLGPPDQVRIVFGFDS